MREGEIMTYCPLNEQSLQMLTSSLVPNGSNIGRKMILSAGFNREM
jgi:hypothetical protein